MRVVVAAAWVLLIAVSCGGGDDPGQATPEPEGGAGGEPNPGGSASENGGADDGMNVPPLGGAGASAAGAAADAGAGGSGDMLLPDEPDNGTLSGSRLKAEWYDFDGTRVFADFYDTELETACLPGAWSDGKQYCIPVSETTLGYSDTECKTMLGYINFDRTCTRPSPRYLVLPNETPGCKLSSAHLYKLADAPTALTEYYASQNGGCSGPFSTGYNSDTYEVTGEVLASDLVEFTREAPADPGRLSRQYIVGADGSRLTIAPHDSETDADCTLTADRVDLTHGSCPPTDSRDVVYYTDQDCKDAVASTNNACKPAFARQLEDRACALGPATYRAVGDAIKPDKLFVGGATVCRSTTPGSSTLYELGKTLTPAALTRHPENIPDRNLQPIYLSDGQKRFLDQRLYDKQNDTECQVNVLRDGTIVCVPYGAGAYAFYDETCTNFVYVGMVYWGADQCQHPPMPRFFTSPYVAASGDCSPGYEIREFGERYTGIPKLKSDTCEVYTGLENDRFYEMGKVRPFSEFPTAKLVRDK